MSIAQIFLFNTFDLTRVIISRTDVDLAGYETTAMHACVAPIDSIYAQFYAIQIAVSSIISFIIISVFTIVTVRHIQIAIPNDIASAIVSNQALSLNTS